MPGVTALASCTADGPACSAAEGPTCRGRRTGCRQAADGGRRWASASRRPGAPASLAAHERALMHAGPVDLRGKPDGGAARSVAAWLPARLIPVAGEGNVSVLAQGSTSLLASSCLAHAAEAGCEAERHHVAARRAAAAGAAAWVSSHGTLPGAVVCCPRGVHLVPSSAANLMNAGSLGRIRKAPAGPAGPARGPIIGCSAGPACTPARHISPRSRPGELGRQGVRSHVGANLRPPSL